MFYAPRSPGPSFHNDLLAGGLGARDTRSLLSAYFETHAPKLSTRANATPAAKPIGMVVVVGFAANASAVPGATIAATQRPT